MHGAGKEIASGRKLTNGLGRTLPPLALGIVLRFCAHHAWNLHRAHALMVGSVDDHLVVILHRAHPEALDGHLHVRLSCADPYLTCYDILDGQRLAIVKGNRQRLVAGLGRLDFHQPFPLLVNFRADGLFTPGSAYFHRLSRLCPSPEAGIRLLLQYHVVANQMGQPYLGLCAERQCRESQNCQNLLHFLRYVKFMPAKIRFLFLFFVSLHRRLT